MAHLGGPAERTREEEDRDAKNHEVKVTEEMVAEAVNSPDRVLTGLGGRQIAERSLDERHVLRVVFINEGETRRVITLYPSRKGRYG